MAKVFLENVSRHFNEIIAVEHMDLEVEDKQFVVLVGPSGCGKTTTLRMVAGLEQITEGNIYIGGRLVNYLSPKDRDIAMVFQNYALYPHMTVYDNLAFGLRLRRFPKDEIDQRVIEAAKILNIEGLLKRRPKTLSGGQRQRVAVGRAIVRKPKVFLFDEPLSNLDAKLRVKMRLELKKLHERLDATIIYVTHDQVEAMTMGDRIVVMNNALKQQEGTPMDLYLHPVNRFVAGFLGTPPMNFLEVDVVSKADSLYIHVSGFKIKIPEQKAKRLMAYPEKQAILGIRPEDLEEVPDCIPGETIEVIVEVIEHLGSTVNLNVKAGDDNLVASTVTSMKASRGQKLFLKVNLENMHLFDLKKEEAII